MARNHSIEFTPEGLEILDQRPMEVPLGYERPLTLQEEIRRMIAVETSRAAEDAGLESFEEADDFDVPDGEDDFVSPYEIKEMTDEWPEESSEPTSGSAGQETDGEVSARREAPQNGEGDGSPSAADGGPRSGDSGA